MPDPSKPGKSPKPALMPPKAPVTPDKDNLMRLAQRLTRGLIGLSVALILAVGAVVTLILTRPAPRYFAVTPALRLIRMAPLNVPQVPPQAVADWAVSTAVDTLSFGFTDWRQTLTRVRDRYSSRAYTQMVSSLTRTLRVIRRHKLEMLVTPTAAAEVVKTGVVDGRYAWLIQFPVLLSFEPRGVVTTQHEVANVVVMQVPPTRNPRQIVVAQMVLSQQSGG